MTGRHALRWWPAAYAAGWTIFALFGTTPRLGGQGWATPLIAGAGAVLLLCLALHPEWVWVRMWATLVAIAFPLYRFLSLAFGEIPLPVASKVVAMTAWALLAISLLVLYPAAWYEGLKRDNRGR